MGIRKSPDTEESAAPRNKSQEKPILIVYLFCIILMISSVASLFISPDAIMLDDDGHVVVPFDMINKRMGNYSSGLVGGHTSSEIELLQLDSSSRLLVNNYDGYSLEVPSRWFLDDKEFGYVLHLRDGSTKITLFKHGLNLSFERVSNYIWYSNDNIRKDYGPITRISDHTEIIGDREFTVVTYERDPITTIEDDMTQYRQYHFNYGNMSVFSFILKTNSTNWDSVIDQLEDSLSTLQIWDVDYQEDVSPVPQKSIDEVLLEGDSRTLHIPDGKKVFGLWHQTHEYYWSEMDELEEDVEYDFHFIMDYFNFRTTFSDTREYLEKQYVEGNVMLISLQPYVSSHGEDYDGNVVMFDMLNGEYDQYLIEWAVGLKDLGEPVFLRFGNEMNGDWTQWCSWFYGLDPDLFIMAWARIHTIFEYIGADNVQFVWNPHDRTYPDYDWQAPYLYYPGDDMVDWIGLTAYNNGVTRPTEVWRDFEECYSDLYDDYMRRFSSKPFMITEFACNEIGGNKSEWIEEGFRSLFDNYPNIWMAVWWNGIDDTWIYDIDSSEGSLMAFKNAMKDPAVLKDPVTRE
ncbi:MAG: glycosyl hydrolase [Candidatus Thermoplasmatota archaeon]|nr:glycosyl hydrolase [Candidatus Thermoplasmatota archaeon]